jgi:rhodanese-related sulfurtransferase
MPILQDISWAAIKALIAAQFPQVKQISTASLAEWLKQPDNHPLLLDARSPEEYQVSHLPDARLVPADLSELQNELQDGKPIVVYCSIGYRSAKLAETLQNSGYSPVFNLEGSIFEWVNTGHPVYQNSEPVNQVHPYNSRWGKLLRSDFHSSCND